MRTQSNIISILTFIFIAFHCTLVTGQPANLIFKTPPSQRLFGCQRDQLVLVLGCFNLTVTRYWSLAAYEPTRLLPLYWRPVYIGRALVIEARALVSCYCCMRSLC